MSRIADVSFVRGAYALAAAAPFTGAAPQTVNGNAVPMNLVRPGTLSARVTIEAETNTITVSAKWQVKDKAGNWIDVAHDSNNPAAVVLATGTSGADAAVEKVLPAPMAVYAFSHARIVFTTGVAVGGGAGVDEITALSYYFVKPGFDS